MAKMGTGGIPRVLLCRSAEAAAGREMWVTDSWAARIAC